MSTSNAGTLDKMYPVYHDPSTRQFEEPLVVTGASWGHISYYNATGTAISVTQNTPVEINPTVTLHTSSINFDSSAAGRLRYTGARTRDFLVTVTVSGVSEDAAGTYNDYKLELYKSGSANDPVKAIWTTSIEGNAVEGTFHAIMSLATNQYVSLFTTNSTDNDDLTVKVLAITAQSLN